MPDLADALDAELWMIERGATQACCHSCECHGGYTCLRARHEHDTPHLGRQEDGSLIQWAAGSCGPAAPIDEPDRAAATRALLAQIDPALLVEALRAGGHL